MSRCFLAFIAKQDWDPNEDMALSIVYRALVMEFRAFWIEDRALLMENRALLMNYRALFVETYGSFNSI